MPGISQTSMQVLWEKSHTQAVSSIWGNHAPVAGKMGHFKKVCMSKKNCTVHEVEVEVMPEPQEENIETVSINSIYLNRNQSLITSHLKMQVGKTATDIPYKIDTGSEGNIMPLYIFQKLFKNARGIAKGLHKKQHKVKNIQWNTYNTTRHMCSHNQIQKCIVCFFVVLEMARHYLGCQI